MDAADGTGHDCPRRIDPVNCGLTERLGWCYSALEIPTGLRERSTVRQASARQAWLLTGILATGFLSAGRADAQLFRSFSNDSRHILEGNWQSCRDRDGQYAERVYDHVVNGVPKFEVHMGPKREFAIFDGVQDAHREHSSSANLLKPYRLDVEVNLASHEWKIPSLSLVFTVSLAGGSRS